LCNLFTGRKYRTIFNRLQTIIDEASKHNLKTAIDSTKVAKIRIAAGIDARNIGTQHADIEGFSSYEASVII